MDAGKMEKFSQLSDFDKGQVVMAIRLGLSISKAAALVGCSRSVLVPIYQKWCRHELTLDEEAEEGHQWDTTAEGLTSVKAEQQSVEGETDRRLSSTMPEPRDMSREEKESQNHRCSKVSCTSTSIPVLDSSDIQDH